MLQEYMSYLLKNSGFVGFILLYIFIFHPIVLTMILYPVFGVVKKRNHIITICILFGLIAAAVPLFHALLFLAIPKTTPIVLKVTIAMIGLCLLFYSLTFELFLRPALLKAWYGKELYKEMFTAPDYTSRLEHYSHSTGVKILGNAMALSLIMTLILCVAHGLYHYYSVKWMLYGMMITTMSIYMLHMYITQHMFKCDCCGRKVLHFVHEHSIHKSWVRQLAPIAMNNYFRCVFCGVQYALSDRTLKKLQRKKMEESKEKL